MHETMIENNVHLHYYLSLEKYYEKLMSTRVAGPRAWNNLPGSIQAIKTLPAFKKQLKLHLLH